MNNRMKIEFTSNPENEAFARAAVAAFVAYLDPTIEELTEIKTGVSEAVSNCIIHAYKDKPGIVSVECIIGETDKILIIIEDEGAGIENVDQAREPMFTTGSMEERSGMGFTVMESFMDGVEVESEIGQGTTITMIKHLDFGHGE